METTFGELKIVPLRDKWKNEASEFTPWLANNIEKLNEAVGLELEVEQTEVSVGPYSADILAKDAGTGRYVVIENQLGKTDHDHLGKAITYASVLDASAVIWIASDFTEEHKKALDWLNDHTSEEISFFGVKLELWQIDNSKSAVKFNVVSNPSEIVRQTAKTKADETLSDNRKLQFEFWKKFRDKLAETKSIPSLQTPGPNYWFDVSLGKSGIHLSNVFYSSENKIGVRVYISNKIADIMLPQLIAHKDEIESELGEKILWNPTPDNIDKIIAVYKQAELSNQSEWDSYLNWLVEKTIKFRKVFSKWIKKADAELVEQ